MDKRAVPFLGLGVVLLLIAAIAGAGLVAGAVSIFRPALAAQLDDAPDPNIGLIVVGIDPLGPAADTSIVRGDILQQANGQVIESHADLVEIFGDIEPGAVVELTILHGDELRAVQISVDEGEGVPALGLMVCCGKNDGPGIDHFQFGPEGFLPNMAVGQPGALILEVVSGSPAEEAGLQTGDLLVTANGVKLGEESDLAEVVRSYEVGETIALEVQRPEEDLQEIDVTLGAHPDRDGDPYLGVRYQSISAMGIQDEEFFFDEGPFGFPPGQGLPDGHPRFHPDGEFIFPEGAGFQGVVIRQVIENTPAEAAGLQAGEIIVAIDGGEVIDPRALIDKISNRAPGDTVVVRVQTPEDELSRDVEVVLGEHPEDDTKGYLGIIPGGGLRFHGFPEGDHFDFEQFFPRFLERFPDGEFEFQFELPNFGEQDA